MKHIIFGGDGFVGRQLATDLHQLGESVVIADIVEDAARHNPHLPHVYADITRPETFRALQAGPGDVIYNLSARILSPLMLRAKRREFFWPVNYDGVANILEWMQANQLNRLVQFTTDMIYGHTHEVPTKEDAPAAPLSEYGLSKLKAEELCAQWRQKGMKISIFRPRLIIGPGRLGILSKLFKLIDYNLPVPMIGGGRNPYQFISVYDCASACVAAWRADFPDAVYNLGSKEPPSVRQLLGELIKEAGSKSILLPTPAPLVKMTLNLLDYINMPLMDPEQYLIADEICILSTAAAEHDLNWKPLYRDSDMLRAAYREYRNGLANAKSRPAAVLTHERKAQ
ncbi:MAG: NAD(P)-dependent oxidoreductase [Alphaproteobacteria bacterium]|nr:NAD(P)-dependent oxidoreductase [Alphaproteobacteria bacterium]